MQHSLRLDDFLWVGIGALLGGGLLVSLFQHPPIVPATSGWQIEDLASDVFVVAVAPTQPQQQQPWQLPSFNLEMPQIKIPQLQRSTQRLEWVIQPEPCPTHEYGNHWSGQTGMNHCLVRVQN